MKNALREAGISALAVLLMIVEVLAVLFSAVIMTLIIVVAFLVRACADAAERGRVRRHAAAHMLAAT